MSNTNRKLDNLIDHLADIRGLLRAAHFAAGGDLASWRGVHFVAVNRHAEAQQKQCRRPLREED